MNLQQLKTFRTVATLLNFNQAAKVLNYAQSTVSAQIKTLEEEIGVHLFERIGKRVALTEAGGKMLIYAQKLLAIEAEALADITGRRDPAGILTLRMPQTVATYHLPPILAEFQSLLPNIRLDVSSCAYHSLEHELQIGTVDLAFLLADSVQAANLEAEVLGIGELVIVADPDSPLARKKDVNYRDLKAHSVFLPKADCGYRMIFEQALATEKIEPSAILEFNSIEAIKKCVMAGLGVTIIPKIAVEEEFKLGKLVQLDWDEDLEVALIMIWHKERWISPTLQLFMETVRRVMSAGGSPK